MILSHRIALDPTVKQTEYFRRASGTARFTYNWALAEWKRQYPLGLKPSALTLKKQFNAVKYNQFPWMKEVHRDAHARPFMDLQKAFSAFFSKKAKYPTFKKRGHHDSFYVANDKFKVQGTGVRLPVLGWVRLREALRFKGKVTGAVVSRTADRWFVAIQVDVGNLTKQRSKTGVVGVDLGLNHFATLSTREQVDAPKPLKASLKCLKRRSKRVSRKVKGSNNRYRAVRRLARLHARISNVRNDFLHKFTTRLCCENQAIAIEDLHVKGMVRNHKLARAISDVGWAEFRRQLEYKCAIYGTELVIVDRFFPSSKTCCRCGLVRDSLLLSERVFRCEACGFEIDRDLNAAINLSVLLDSVPVANGEFTPVDIEALAWKNCPSETSVIEAGTKPCSLVSTN